MARRLGSAFGFLWAAYAVSTLGTWVAFDAFSIIAIRTLRAGPGAVAAVTAAGLVAGAAMAIPLGAWVERQPKRPVMVATDLGRAAALSSLPLAYGAGRLGLVQLAMVAVAMATATIVFRAASGAYLKTLMAPADLPAASARLEATLWTATALGPPLGGIAIGWCGPMATIIADAGSYGVSALVIGLLVTRGGPVLPAPTVSRDWRLGWRHIWAHPQLRPIFCNTVLVNGLIMATAPLMAVLMLGRLGFAPWQYGVAFGVPCLGGLVGAQMAARLVARFGADRVLRGAGALRACWSIGLAAIGGGRAGLIMVIVIQFGLVASCAIFNPVLAARRLEQTAADQVARTLSAWFISTNIAIAAMTLVWGQLAALVGERAAIAAAGLLLLATPLLLPAAEDRHR